MEIINNTREVIINETTTLGELINMLALGEKPHDTPTPKYLRENAGEPIAESPDPLDYGTGCIVYANGYAVYDNGSGRTVVWLPDCTSFTYNFVKPKESEVGICPEKVVLEDDMLISQPWAIPVTLLGEHRIENLVHHRKSDRKENKSLIRGDKEESDAIDEMEQKEDSLRKRYTWRESSFGEDPLEVYIRKETQEEFLEKMTPKQRRVFSMYYREGFNQKEIAELMRISQVAVHHLLEKALGHAKKILK